MSCADCTLIWEQIKNQIYYMSKIDKEANAYAAAHGAE